jgi:hypothetical protein
MADSTNSRYNDYEHNKKRVESGKPNHVPFFGFNKLQNYIPGIVPGIMYKITSHMGVGKTQIAKFMFVIQPVLYAMKYKKDFKVLYFALEESKEEFIDSLFIHVAKRIHGVQLDRFKLMGMHDTPLSQVELDALKASEAMVNEMMTYIEVIDDVYKPTDMFKVCASYARKWGTFGKDKEGNTDFNVYTPHNPSSVRLVATDHISLIERDYDKAAKQFLSDFQSIALWHTKMLKRIITKQWKWSAVNIQQQSLESEKQQYTMKGESIVEKILPGLDGLANNREVARDDYVVLGLFAPDRYGIKEYKGYHIANNTPKSFEDRFRSLHLLKNRFGHPNKILPLYFDGRYNYFKEMCLPGDPDMAYFLNLLKS